MSVSTLYLTPSLMCCDAQWFCRSMTRVS